MLRRHCVVRIAGLLPLGYVSLWPMAGSLAAADSKPINSLDDLVDQVIDVELVDETYLADVTLVELVKEDGAITAIMVRSDANPRRIAAKEIAELYVDGEPCDVRVDPESRGLDISAKKRAERIRAEEETTARLTSRKQKPWPRSTAALHAQAMREHEEHLSQVRKVFPARTFDVEQSRYYILCSDLAPLETRQILAALDRLYDTLCDGFGIPIGKNVWYGKCIVHAFRERTDYLAWEEHYYKDGATKSGAKVHWNLGTGRVIIALSPQKSLPVKLGLLVHETTFGLIHRYRSSMPVPKWMRVGIAEWAAETVVPDFDAPTNRREAAIAACKRAKTVPFEFFADEGVVEGDAGAGLASALIRFLAEKNKAMYRQFCLAIKEGRSAEESLQLVFGWDYDALLKAFGTKIGVPKLRRLAR
jgi:hypothetical protein